jgi:hypothetical protein
VVVGELAACIPMARAEIDTSMHLHTRQRSPHGGKKFTRLE